MKTKTGLKKSISFLLGVCSTLQLLTIAGINAFSIIALIYVLFKILSTRRLPIDRKSLLIILSLLLSLISNIFISNRLLPNADQWKVSCIKSSAIFVIIVLSYVYMKHENDTVLKIFFRGVYYSCLIQLGWGYFQFIMYSLLSTDINQLIFVEWLHIFDVFESFNTRGHFNVTGLNTNAGVLAPILLYLFFTTKKELIKVMALLLLFISGNSTNMICGLLVLAIFAVSLAQKKNRINKHKLIMFSIIFLLVIVLIMFHQDIVDRILVIYKSLLDRLNSIRTLNWTEGSTFVHYRYYSSFPTIIASIGVLRVLFGFGFKCGGAPFVIFYNQYPDTIYGTESDPISFLYGLGIFGLVIFYSILIKIVMNGRKIDKAYAIYLSIICIGGIFYSLQMNWLILIELLFTETIRRKMKMSKLVEETK